MSEVRLPSSTIWLNSAHIEHWLAGLWPGWRIGDVRHAWDGEKRWYWVVPDYDKGRSRVVGMPVPLLETTTVSKLQEVLEDHDWLHRIEQEALLVGRGEDGEWTVEAWDPPVDEAWFPDPNGGYFVALKDAGHHVAADPLPHGPLTDSCRCRHRRNRLAASYSRDQLPSPEGREWCILMDVH